MRILWASAEGDGADIALRLKLEGHQVRLWIKDPEDRVDTYDGIVDKVPSFWSALAWADMVICDHTGLSEVHKAAEAAGKPVFGGCPWADKIEKDRGYGNQVLAQIGLKKPEALAFKRIEQAVEHLKTHKVRHAVKPVGPKVMSYHVILGEFPDNSDAVDALELFKASGTPYEQIELEEYIEGVEAACTAWCNGQELEDPNVNFEEKPLAAGGLGPLTGEMGEVMLPVDLSNEFYKRTTALLLPVLRKERYRGVVDIGFKVRADGSGEVPTEITARLGYPPIFIMAELAGGSLAEKFMAAALGKPAPWQAQRVWGCAVVMVTPGFPSREEVDKRSAESRIYGVDVKKPGGVHLVEATYRGGKLRTTDGHGYPLVLTGQGGTIDAAREAAYARVKPESAERVYIRNAWWRTDIGRRVVDKLEFLKERGIVPGDGHAQHQDQHDTAQGTSLPNGRGLLDGAPQAAQAKA